MSETNKHQMNQNYDYLYEISYRREFKQICEMEMRHIFGNTTSNVYHLSNENIDITRSPFIKGRIKITHTDTLIKTIESSLIENETFYQDYKIQYLKYDKVEYPDRIQAMRILGTAIEGDFAIKNPKVSLALTKVDGNWIFGLYEVNPNEWLARRKKPFSYSNALEVKLARVLLNIAIENDFSKSIVDPCCGIGTVVIEAKSMGLNIKGYEINRFVAQHANSNLTHFGFEPDISRQDMFEIEQIYDVAILDLPYGQFSSITYQEQMNLIEKTRTISKKAVIISMDEITKDILSHGYVIIDKAKIEKSNSFSRHIYFCE